MVNGATLFTECEEKLEMVHGVLQVQTQCQEYGVPLDDDPEILPCRCGKRPVLTVIRCSGRWQKSLVQETIQCECKNAISVVHEFGFDAQIIQSWNSEFA